MIVTRPRVTALSSVGRVFPALSNVQVRYASSQDNEAKVQADSVEEEVDEKDDYHSIIKDNEKAKGLRYEFNI